MADESINIEVVDKVASSISTKIRQIATDSRDAYSAVEKLQSIINSLKPAAINAIATAANSATTALNSNAVAQQNLAAATSKAQAAASQAAAAQTRATTAQTQGATAAQTLAAATARTATAQTASQTAAAKLATEQQRTATQANNAAAAQDRAALAALRLQQAQDKAAKATSGGATALAGYVKQAAALLGLGIGAKEIIDLGDAYTTLQNKLQNVTTSQAQVNELTSRLFELANQTRAPVDETVTAFTRFDRALKGLGKSQEDTLRLTQTVNEALVTSGATAPEAASALLQLSQAFNSGKLQGDEFRAVSENLPVVLDAVAKAVGKPISQVKQLASEGKITSEVLYNAFTLIQGQIDATFAKTLPTVAQAFTVLKNSALEAFGEFNKAAGITENLAKFLLLLANNMKLLSVIAVALGAALLVAFGPTIWAALGTATAAVWAFTTALLANPIGLIAVVIATATAALIAFGNTTNAGIDDVTTLGDVASAVWKGIKDGLSDIAGLLADAFAPTEAEAALDQISGATKNASDSWTDSYSDFFKTQDSGWAGSLEVVAKTIDAIAGLLTGLGESISRVFSGLPDLFRNIFNDVYNAVVTRIQDMVNASIDAINKLGQIVGTDLIDHVELATKNVDQDYWKKYGQNIAAGIDAGFDQQGGFMQGLLKDTLSSAQQIAKAREAANKGPSTLRGAGANTTGDGSNGKATEKRATSLAKVNLELDNQLSRMDMLKDARDVQQQYDRIEEQLAGKKITLTQSESAAIMEKIKAIQSNAVVQQKFDAIYEEAIGPSRDYNATLTAANKLLSTGAISFDQFSRAVVKAGESYKQALDPLYSFNRDLQQEMDLLKLLPQQREIEQRVMQVQNDLLSKGIILNDTQVKGLRDELAVRQQLNDVSQQSATLLSNSVDKRKAETDQITALKQLSADPKSGFTSGDQSAAVTSSLQSSGIDTSAFAEQSAAYTQQYADMYAQIDQLRQANLLSEQSAAAATAQVWAMNQKTQLGTTQTFLTGLAAMQNSHNKEQARIGKAAAIANATISTYLGAVQAFTSLSAIPIVGPILGGVAAAAAVVAGLAQIQQIRSVNTTGFKEGGYTGDLGVSKVAGVVHGKEYVSDAATTARYRPYLEAMSNGSFDPAKGSQAPAAGAQAPSPTVNVHPATLNQRLVVVSSQEEARNYASTDEFENRVLDINRMNGIGP